MGPEDSTSSSMQVKAYLIPRFTANGSNWITWKQQTLSSLMSNKGVQRHLEGTACVPPPIPMYNPNHQLNEDELEELDNIEEKWDMYNQREASIKAQILTTIPESLAIKIQALVTSKKLWDTLCEKHKKRALTVVVDLWHRLYALKCLYDSNVKAHIQSLNAMNQQLKGMGEEIGDSNFTTLILTSLPKFYRPLINTISLQNYVSTKPLEPSTIMESILEEFDQLQIEESQLKAAENAILVK